MTFKIRNLSNQAKLLGYGHKPVYRIEKWVSPMELKKQQEGKVVDIDQMETPLPSFIHKWKRM
jgi:hypothetical protein